MDDDVAALMITNPNTLGLFEREIAQIAAAVHARGGLVYLDGANLNALMGVAKPGAHGRRRACSSICTRRSRRRTAAAARAPVRSAVRSVAGAVPAAAAAGARRRPRCAGATTVRTSIGRVRAFHGNVGMLVRAYAYILALGRRRADPRHAHGGAERQLHPRAAWRAPTSWPTRAPCMHECVFTDKGFETARRARRSTSPSACSTTASTRRRSTSRWSCSGAMMIEPTETESKETLDEFIAAMLAHRARGARGRPTCCTTPRR